MNIRSPLQVKVLQHHTNLVSHKLRKDSKKALKQNQYGKKSSEQSTVKKQRKPQALESLISQNNQGSPLVYSLKQKERTQTEESPRLFTFMNSTQIGQQQNQLNHKKALNEKLRNYLSFNKFCKQEKHQLQTQDDHQLIEMIQSSRKRRQVFLNQLENFNLYQNPSTQNDRIQQNHKNKINADKQLKKTDRGNFCSYKKMPPYLNVERKHSQINLKAKMLKQVTPKNSQLYLPFQSLKKKQTLTPKRVFSARNSNKERKDSNFFCSKPSPFKNKEHSQKSLKKITLHTQRNKSNNVNQYTPRAEFKVDISLSNYSIRQNSSNQKIAKSNSRKKLSKSKQRSSRQQLLDPVSQQKNLQKLTQKKKELEQKLLSVDNTALFKRNKKKLGTKIRK